MCGGVLCARPELGPVFLHDIVNIARVIVLTLLLLLFLVWNMCGCWEEGVCVLFPARLGVIVVAMLLNFLLSQRTARLWVCGGKCTHDMFYEYCRLCRTYFHH